MQKNKEMINWINVQKVVCMFVVYLYHTEGRFGLDNESLHAYFFPWYVNSFFFISGYLCYKSHVDGFLKLSPLSWFKQTGARMLNNVFCRIIWPTMLFSAVMYLPKIIIRGQQLTLHGLATATISGGAFWFTSALAVAELIMFSLLSLKRDNIKMLLFIALALSIFSYHLPTEIKGGYFWEYQKAFLATIYLAIGMACYKYENQIDRIINNKYGIFSLLASFIMLIIIWQGLERSLVKYLVYVTAAIISIAVLRYFCMNFSSAIITKLSRYTIGVYFLSGAIPETMCKAVFFKVSINPALGIIVVATLSFAMAFGIVFLLNRYVPFMFDFKKIYSKNSQK